MVAGGRGASCFRRPMGRCSRFDHCMPGRFGVGHLACGLFTVGSFFPQQFGRYPVVSAALWSACASWGRLRCSPLRCSRMSSLLSSRFVLGFAVAGLSIVVVVLRPGRARRVVWVCRCRGRHWSARPGLCGGLYGPGWPHLVAVGCPLLHFSVGHVLSWLARLRRVRRCGRCVVASTLFGTPSSSPANGQLVLSSDAFGRGGRVGSVPVVPVALGRHVTF